MQRLRLFSICSNSSQRNSIFILYNKGAVREEQKNILPRCHAGNENRASPAEAGRRGPFKKHCPLLMRGNSQGSGQTTNHRLTAAKVWEFSYTASAAFSSFPRRCLFLYFGVNLSVSAYALPLPGLRHPASAALRLRLAGRCPNNDSLLPPLAAVVVVAPCRGASGEEIKLCEMPKALPLGELARERLRGQGRWRGSTGAALVSR